MTVYLHIATFKLSNRCAEWCQTVPIPLAFWPPNSPYL